MFYIPDTVNMGLQERVADLYYTINNANNINLLVAN